MFICSECQNIPIIKINNNINIECSCGIKQCEQINKLKIKQINSSCIIDNKQSTLYCPFCNISLCQNCGTIHNILYKHSSLFSIISHNYCLRHYEEKILYYCDECKVNQCNECFKSEKVDCLLYDFNDCIDIYKAFISAIKDKNCIIGRKLFFLFIENYNINNIKNSFINFLQDNTTNKNLINNCEYIFKKKQKNLELLKLKEIPIEKIVGRKEFECKCLTSFKDGRIALAEYNKINNNIYILNPQNNFSFEIRIEQAHINGIHSLCIVNDKIISSSNNETIKLWEIKKETYLHLGNIELVNYKVITISKTLIACYSNQNCEIKIYNCTIPFQCIQTLTNSSNITSLLKLSHINYLLSSSEDYTLRWWNLLTNKCEYKIDNVENSKHIYELDNNKILVVLKDELLIIDAINHQLLETFNANFKHLTSFILFSGVFILALNNTLNKLNPDTFKHENIFDDNSFSLITKNTNNTIVSYGNRKLAFWQYTCNKRVVIQKREDYINDNIKKVYELKIIKRKKNFSHIICVISDEILLSCDNQFFYYYSLNYPYRCQSKFITKNQEKVITSLCLIKDILISCGDKGYINLWKISVNSIQYLQSIKGHNVQINKVIPLQKMNFATCSNDKTIKIWERNPLTCIKILTGHNWDVYSIIKLQKRECIISSSGDNTLRWWNLQNFQCIYIMNDINCSSFSDALYEINNNRIAVGLEGKVLIIDSLNCKIIKEIAHCFFSKVTCFGKDEKEFYFCNEKGEIIKLNLNTYEYYQVSLQMKNDKEIITQLIYLNDGIFATSGWKIKIWKKC